MAALYNFGQFMLEAVAINSRIRAKEISNGGAINGGSSTVKLNYFVRTQFKGISLFPEKIVLEKMENKKHKVIKEITQNNVNKFFEFLNLTSVYSNHRNVKDNVDWDNHYGIDNITFKTYDKDTDTLTDEVTRGYPCRDCGLVLPKKLISVDHQAPQSGGNYKAVLRVFRSLGLTKGTATGTKNSGLRAAWRNDVGGDAGIVGSKASRYTLNDAGIIYWTIISRDQGNISNFMRDCMNNYANLRPTCQPCNSSKGNV